MKKLFLALLVELLFLNNFSMASELQNDHNLSRWSSSSNTEKSKLVQSSLQKMSDNKILLIPFVDAQDKKDATQQLYNCVEIFSTKLPGQSIGAAMLHCCKEMGYINIK